MFRKQYDPKDFGDIRKPKCVRTNTLSKLLEAKLLRSGVAEKTNETESTKHGQKRNPIARAHGFRKLVTTNMVRAKVNPEAREMLLGHSIGLNKAYYRPREDELLEEYLKAVEM